VTRASAIFSCVITLLAVACGSSSPAQNATLDLTVDGMHCSGCVEAITAEVREVPGVESVAVSLEGHSAQVMVDSPSRRDAVVRAISGLGYSVTDRTTP
jgi:copper chaperone CopZ